tara:strand:+ start:8184 stop:8432 length:249 start_codon:yes stop_codon:yes gene_type:complete
MENIIFQLIREGVCKYTHSAKYCSIEDINNLCKECVNLINKKNLDYDIWLTKFKLYLKIDSIQELENLIKYIQNRTIIYNNY